MTTEYFDVFSLERIAENLSSNWATYQTESALLCYFSMKPRDFSFSRFVTIQARDNRQRISCGARVSGARGIDHFGAPSPLLSPPLRLEVGP